MTSFSAKEHVLISIQRLTFAAVVLILLTGGLALSITNVPPSLYDPSSLNQSVLVVALLIFPFLGLAPLIGWWYNFSDRQRMRLSGTEAN